MLAPKFVSSLILLTSAVLLDQVESVTPTVSPTRQRPSAAQATAKAQATTDGSNFVSTSANGIPGTTKKKVSEDGVTMESTSEYVSPDGNSRSFSKSTSSSSTTGNSDGKNRNSSPVDSKRVKTKNQGTNEDGSNITYTSTNGTPGQTKKAAVTTEAKSDYVSPDGKSRSSSKSTSSSTATVSSNRSSNPPEDNTNKQGAAKTQGTTNVNGRNSGSTSVESVVPKGSPSRHRLGTADHKQASAKAHGSTTEGSNFVSTSANGIPGTTKKMVTDDGVIMESTSEYVSPDGKNRSYSKSSSSSKNRQ